MNIFFVFLLSFLGFQNPQAPQTPEISRECEIAKIHKIIDGKSMEPMILDNSEIILLKNFYKCSGESPQKGDLVAYKYGGNSHPLIKKIIATPSNTIEIRNKKLFIDEKEIQNSEGKSYEFSDTELQMFLMYLSEKNHLPENSYFVLGDNINNSIDSRRFGAISQKDFLGKFEEKKPSL